MRAKFSQSFKVQAVEKALSRSDVTSLREISDSLGIGELLSNLVFRRMSQAAT